MAIPTLSFRWLFNLAVLILVIAGFGSPALAAERTLCSAVSTATKTIIAFQPPASFAICRGGVEREDVMVGDPVYLELIPIPTSELYAFQLDATQPSAPTGLGKWILDATEAARTLEAMGESGLSLDALPLRAPAPAGQVAPANDLSSAREVYLGVVTPAFLDLLTGLPDHVDRLRRMVTGLGVWCRAVSARQEIPAHLAERAGARCFLEGSTEDALLAGADSLLKSAEVFNALRRQARTTLLLASARPSPAATAQALQTIQGAAQAAEAIVELSGRIAPAARQLSRSVALLRKALQSTGSLRPNVPTLLTRYDRAGTAVLQIRGRAVDLVADGEPEPGSLAPGALPEPVDVTFRFSVLEWHLVDFNLGLGFTGGVPDRPTLGSGMNGTTVLTSQPVDEFVALLFAELEPLKFMAPDKEIAGLLRFPVIGVPLTRDPTQNFFAGAGLGWTGVGSLDFGPYFLREAVLGPGNALGEAVPQGTSLSQITNAGLRVGYFVSANVDLLGLVHLFVHPKVEKFDASTGNGLQ